MTRKIRTQLWTQARKADRKYQSQLRQVARAVDSLIRGLNPDGSPQSSQQLLDALRAYSRLLEPWAQAVGSRMLADVDRRDRAMWKEHAQTMGVALRRELEQAPTGALMREMLDEQVRLITSLPEYAAQRVHDLTTEAIVSGERPKDLAERILRLGSVTEARAQLIARTEVARTASSLTQARSQHAGSEGYIWRTVEDSDVRHSHAEMEGRYVRWDTPPTLSDGTTTHAGQIYNCRCYAEVVLPED